MLLDMFIKAVQNSIEFAEGVSTMFPFPTFSVQSPSTTTHEGTIITTPVSALPSADLGELNSNLSCFILELDLLVKQVRTASGPSDESNVSATKIRWFAWFIDWSIERAKIFVLHIRGAYSYNVKQKLLRQRQPKKVKSFFLPTSRFAALMILDTSSELYNLYEMEITLVLFCFRE